MDKRSDILRTAQNLFGQFGLKKVTCDEIAKQATVSKATLYKYYRNKNDVFAAVVEMESAELWNAIYKAVNNEMTVVGKLKAHLLTKMEKLHQLVNFYKVSRETWNGYWPYIDNVREKFMAKEKEMVAGILELGNQTGELQVEKTALTAHIMVITLKSLEFPWAIEGHDISLPVFVDMMVSQMLNGIGKN